MTGLLRCGLVIILCATLLGIGGAWAADVPAHLVGMARLLTSQIDAADFAASGDPALAQRVDGIIKRAR